MNRPTLPRGTIPAGATHFYFDPNSTRDAANPWRRLDIDNSWHMLRGDGWIRISGSRSYNFVAITDMLPGGTFYELQEMTVRDQFAAAALQGMLSALDASGLNYSNPKMMAEHAYGFAEAMLVARGVKP